MKRISEIPGGLQKCGDFPGGSAAANARPLLAIVEPGSSVSGAAGRAFLAEARRVAERLGREVRFFSWSGNGELDAEQLARGLARAALSCRAALVLLADTALGREVAPLLALALDGDAILGCSNILVKEERGKGIDEGRLAPVFVKPVYGGWLEQDIEAREGQVVVATLQVDSLEGPGDDAGVPVREVVDIPMEKEPRVRRLELIPPDPRSVDLVHAQRVVAAGLGAADEALLEMVRELADLLEGSLGATRPVVDEGWFPKERLIGQTGRTVTPRLYLALGVSGSPHHLAGVRKAERVLSINRDMRAPIFQFSDVGYVADLKSVLPFLIRRIKEWRDAGTQGVV